MVDYQYSLIVTKRHMEEIIVGMKDITLKRMCETSIKNGGSISLIFRDELNVEFLPKTLQNAIAFKNLEKLSRIRKRKVPRK